MGQGEAILGLVWKGVFISVPVVDVPLYEPREDNKEQHQDVNCCKNFIYSGRFFNTKCKNP